MTEPLTSTRRPDPRRQRSAASRRRRSGGGLTALVGALTEGYIELVGESVRCAGNTVGDLAEDCARSASRRTRRAEDAVRGTRYYDERVQRRRYDDDDEYDDDPYDYYGRYHDPYRGDPDCGCSVTGETVVDDVVDVIDSAVDRFHDALDARRPAPAYAPDPDRAEAVRRTPSQRKPQSEGDE